MYDVRKTQTPYLKFYHCEQCDFSTDGTIPADERAEEHVAKTGHTVFGTAEYKVKFERSK
jgi:hypothetical protein